MIQSSARMLPKKAPAAFVQPEDDWEPLHPLHRRLVDEYSGGGAIVRHGPRFGARLAIITALAIASWAVVLATFKLLTIFF